MHIAFPYHIDRSGRTAVADPDDHVRQLLEQVLFTSPGERVRRPTFGTGLRQLAFASGQGDELASAVQLLVQGALQSLLGELLQLDAVEVESQESSLRVTVRYLVRRTQEARQVSFDRTLGG